MLIGGGGREHAIVKELKKSPRISKLYALPGNGGIADYAKCVEIRATEIERIVLFAKENAIDFAIVAPDDPLILGLVDRLREIGVRAFGPSAKAAAIEGSKLFAKQLMQKYHIPTAAFASFEQAEEAYAYLETTPYPVVIKADGPALGKGVIIAQTLEEAKKAVFDMMEQKVFGESGCRIVVEEHLSGPEVSVLAFTDGTTIVPMISALDHKRAFDDDMGPNTGGMGVLAPNPYYNEETAKVCMERIFRPTIDAMRTEGRLFQGVLYFGLMLTKEGPKVIEYNCRFGDPEAQAVLPLLKSDLFEIMLAVEENRLSEMKIEFDDSACCCVIMASKGYPGQYETGYEIQFNGAGLLPDTTVYHAGTKRVSGQLFTSGGRVLCVSAVAPTAQEAIDSAYRATDTIYFQNAFCRRDIGKRALSLTRKKEN